MADVIPIEERLKRHKAKEISKEKKRKLDTFRMTMQCTACHLKCARCGSQLEVLEPRTLSEEMPIRLCAACWEEYEFFEKVRSGRTPVEERLYYHNEAWVNIWRSWLDYQKNLQRYRTSREFMKLMDELSKE
jgi:hypothetical protein